MLRGTEWKEDELLDLKLNVGCGCDNWGDIRLDIERYSSRYRKPTTANIIADVHHLPFRPKVFSHIRCYHVLEHLENPILALQEMKRVCNGIIDLKYPIWHLWNYIGEALYLIKKTILLPLIGLESWKTTLTQIKRWKERYADHKWYIHLGGEHKHYVFHFIPKEYHKIIKVKT